MASPIRRITALASATALCTFLPFTALAETMPQFAGMFSDHAVLQRNEPVRVWGTASPNQPLTLKLNGQSVAVKTDARGQWLTTLPAQAAGGPYTLSVSDGQATTALNDILIGDVFLCSGQSNMEFPVKYATNAWNEIHSAANPNLRFINIARDGEGAPLSDLKTAASWQVAGPETSGEASAVCYYMAKSLQKTQNVPIGFIDSYWGGTMIQTWISDPALRTFKTYNDGLDAMKLYAGDPVAARAKWAATLDGRWQAAEPDGAAHTAWTRPDFDDSAWPVMTPSGHWEESGLPAFKAFDGIVWYRTTITLTPEQAQSAMKIDLGPVDDSDITWVNGVVLGSTSAWDAPRTYSFPKGALRAGKNVVVVRVTDNGAGGGLWGQPKDRRITLASGAALPLPAEWKYKIAGQPVPDAPSIAPAWASPVGPAMLYNGMIAPLTHYNIKAVAWYQGEANAGLAEDYARLLPAWMADWRAAFQKPDLPFLIVQLANFGDVAAQPGRSDWAELREVQRLTVKSDPHAALAVTIDVGDRTDIHPTQKTVVGERLARAARSVVYGEAVSPGGPEPVSINRGSAGLSITFKNTGGGLKSYSSKLANGFEVCTAKDVCQYIMAFVMEDHVVLLEDFYKSAKSIRYAWANAPYTNLYSGDDLPAVPFQMDIPQ